MDALMRPFNAMLRGEGGATATEYAVMLALIFLVVVGTVGSMGLAVASKLAIPGW